MNRSDLAVWPAAAFIWGLTEATFFFVVPDVLLTAFAQSRGVRRALTASAYAVAGACLGGMLMWHLARDYPAEVRAFLDYVPAISAEMIARVQDEVRDDAVSAMLAGAFSGTPYKIFAAAAPGAGISRLEFLAVSVPARALRFVLLVLVTAILNRLAAPWLSSRSRSGLLFAGWIIFYAVFWLSMPN